MPRLSQARVKRPSFFTGALSFFSARKLLTCLSEPRPSLKSACFSERENLISSTAHVLPHRPDRFSVEGFASSLSTFCHFPPPHSRKLAPRRVDRRWVSTPVPRSASGSCFAAPTSPPLPPFVPIHLSPAQVFLLMKRRVSPFILSCRSPRAALFLSSHAVGRSPTSIRVIPPLSFAAVTRRA